MHPAVGKIRMTDTEKGMFPRWAMEPLDQFLESIRSTHDFYHLTIDGLRMIIRHHEFLVVTDERIKELNSRLLELGGEPKETERAQEISRAQHREQAKERADLAQREVSNGFPVLHNQQVVSLWSSIECFVEDVLAAWLANDPQVMRNERVRKIKIPLSDFDRLNESERKYYLVSELQRDPGLSQRHEIERFETLLAIAGLSGVIDADVKRDLIELGHIRNVLLHRRGIADAKFVQACPWLTTRLGERVVVDSSAVERYTAAAMRYLELMLARMKVLFKIDDDEAKKSV